MKLSMPLSYAGGFKESAERVAALEKAGLDTVWVAEAYGFDGVSLMGYLAAKTERVQIGSAILPIYTRTPSLLAMTAAGLDALSDGRFILGIGASGPQVIEGFHGVPYDMPLTRTREVVEICRKVWRRERVTHEGRAYTLPLPPDQGTGLGKPLKLITHPVRERIPVYIASLGPKNVQLTAEIADGWLPIFFLPEKFDEVWGDDLRAGFAKRSDDLGPLEIVAGGLVAVGEDAAKMRDLARPMVALYVGGMGARGRNFYNDLACRFGFEAEAKQIQDLYLDGKKDEAAAAVPEGLLEAATICGPEGYVRERIAAFKEVGVTSLNVTPIAEDVPALVSKLKEWVADA
ncbi:MAG: LLM class F420-dependent oxidoreductase [Thermoanaerobacterales bacterium]|jgi:F420-dependent oxidoreductase-like protein|nr:LLM class F420-dependent oxidoreductase [Thermoanaerobacterales bacterium]